MLYALMKPLALAAMRLLFRLRSWGTEHVPATGPVLLVANHTSLLDPALVGGVCSRPLTFLAKAELFRIPLFGPFIRRLNAQPLRREGGDAAALRTALRVLKAGGALLVFPEGTRTDEEGRLGTPKPGAGMLAVLGGAPVIPVYIHGSGRAWPRGRRFPRATDVTVTFGSPLPVMAGGHASRKDEYEAVSRQMMAAIEVLRDSASSGNSRAISDESASDGGAPAPRRPAADRHLAREERRAVGGVGVGGAPTSPKYTDGRSR